MGAGEDQASRDSGERGSGAVFIAGGTVAERVEGYMRQAYGDRRERVVPLSDFGADLWAGLLFPLPSGVVFVHQGGGVMHATREVEGVLVPLPHRLLGYDLMRAPLEALWDEGLGAADADLLDRLLASYRLPLRVDRTRLAEGMKAWIPVEVSRESGEWASLWAFRGRGGVLVHPNDA